MNNTVDLTGQLKLVKTGPGLLICSKSGQSYTGGTDILGGILRTAITPGNTMDNGVPLEERLQVKNLVMYPKRYEVEVDGETVHLTKKEYDVAKNIMGKIDCSVDKKTNVITIEVEDQDPLIAATVADSLQMHLQRTITDYRTKKARVDLEYMQKLFDEAYKEYSKARQRYAAFGDSYSNLKMQSYVLKGDELENEMQLKYTIYQQVVEQLQLAKAKVQERTPAFTIVQEATVPVKHSSRPKIVTLIIWMILGFLLRAGILLWRNRQSFINI